MSRVIAVREQSEYGPFYGFELDSTVLDCERCKHASYQIRYTKDQRGRMENHGLQVHRLIQNEHPKHSDRIELPV